MRLTKKQIAKLREVRRMATFESANFEGMMGQEKSQLPKTEGEVTAFIRERTRLYRETWILPVLDELLREGSAK